MTAPTMLSASRDSPLMPSSASGRRRTPHRRPVPRCAPKVVTV